jgi:hypothetical protein
MVSLTSFPRSQMLVKPLRQPFPFFTSLLACLVTMRGNREMSMENNTMSKQVWGLLSRRPGATRERCYAMTHRQIHPLNKSGIESSREA